MSIPLDFCSPVLSSSQESPQLSDTSILGGNTVQLVAAARNVHVQQQPNLSPLAAIVGNETAQYASATIQQSNAVPASTGNTQQLRFLSPVAILVNKPKQQLHNLSPVVGSVRYQLSLSASHSIRVNAVPASMGNIQQLRLSPVATTVNKLKQKSASTTIGVKTVQKISVLPWSTTLKKKLKSPPVATSTPAQFPPTAGPSSIMIDGVKFLVLNRAPLKEVNSNIYDQ